MSKVIERIIVIEPYFEGENLSEKQQEISALVEASGSQLIEIVVQKIRGISASTFVGSGKLNEVKNKIEEENIECVVFDGELSPSQQNNISDILNCKVISRTTLILDIFAQRAFSVEGKILVELAQLKYIYPRLSGKGVNLSRLGGGIGTRGPGETQLETDRRHIKTRIKFLEKSLKEIEKRRAMQQTRREKNGIKTVALVGYTNTGKSTLLNLLTNSDVLAKNQLFATLDPTARKAEINGYELLFIDTVGFVKSLPADLMDAFKSTLECCRYADLILNICDSSSNWEMQIETTLNTLSDLKSTAPIIFVANKCDLSENVEELPKNFIKVSALKNIGIIELKNKIKDILFGETKVVKFFLDYKYKYNLTKIKLLCKRLKVNYLDNGVTFDIETNQTDYEKLISLFKEFKNNEKF